MNYRNKYTTNNQDIIENTPTVPIISYFSFLLNQISPSLIMIIEKYSNIYNNKLDLHSEIYFDSVFVL